MEHTETHYSTSLSHCIIYTVYGMSEIICASRYYILIILWIFLLFTTLWTSYSLLVASTSWYLFLFGLEYSISVSNVIYRCFLYFNYLNTWMIICDKKGLDTTVNAVWNVTCAINLLLVTTHKQQIYIQGHTSQRKERACVGLLYRQRICWSRFCEKVKKNCGMRLDK